MIVTVIDASTVLSASVIVASEAAMATAAPPAGYVVVRPVPATEAARSTTGAAFSCGMIWEAESEEARKNRKRPTPARSPRSPKLYSLPLSPAASTTSNESSPTVPLAVPPTVPRLSMPSRNLAGPSSLMR